MVTLFFMLSSALMVAAICLMRWVSATRLTNSSSPRPLWARRSNLTGGVAPCFPLQFDLTKARLLGLRIFVAHAVFLHDSSNC